MSKLTEYRGVSVTPKIFNNLLKTVASHNNFSANSSRTKFEERMREIILVFNPLLKKNSDNMSTEYLLISCLKSDKKEVVHTYNYNNCWDRMNDNENMDVDEDNNEIVEKMKEICNCEWSDDRLFELIKLAGGHEGRKWAKKIKKKYSKHVEGLVKNKKSFCEDKEGRDDVKKDENVLFGFRSLLGVKRINYEKCVALLNIIRQLVEKWTDGDDTHDTVEKYIYSIKIIGEKLNEKKIKMDELEEKLRTAVSENESNNSAIKRLTDELEVEKKQLMVIKSRYNEQRKENENLIKTITENSLNLAKMGRSVGEKDEIIEKTIRELDEVRINYTNLDEMYEAAKMNIRELDNEISCLREEKEKQEYLMERINFYENAAEEWSKEKSILKAAVDNTAVFLENAETTKDDLLKRITETNCAYEDLCKEHERLVEHNSLAEHMLSQKELELKMCKGRLCDKEQEIKNLESKNETMKMDLERCERRVKEVSMEKQKIEDEMNKLHEETCEIMEEKCKLELKHKQLENEIKEKEKMKTDVESVVNKGVKRKSQTYHSNNKNVKHNL